MAEDITLETCACGSMAGDFTSATDAIDPMFGDSIMHSMPAVQCLKTLIALTTSAKDVVDSDSSPRLVPTVQCLETPLQRQVPTVWLQKTPH